MLFESCCLVAKGFVPRLQACLVIVLRRLPCSISAYLSNHLIRFRWFEDVKADPTRQTVTHLQYSLCSLS